MYKDYIYKLTIGLYRVTNLFPEKEPLKYKVREIANDIYGKIYQMPTQDRRILEDILININVLNAFLELVKINDWVSGHNIQILINSYSLLGDKIRLKQISDTKKPKSPVLSAPRKRQPVVAPVKENVSRKLGSNTIRRADIQKILSQKGPKRLIQLLESFPQINKRTLRRDLTAMVDNNILERYDVGKLTFYKIKSV